MKAPIPHQVLLSGAQGRFAVVEKSYDFSTLYRERFASVAAWLRALGVPDSELEDVSQEVFLVVRRKLENFDGNNLDGWLYRIAQRTASDHRRRAWFRRWFVRAHESELDQLPDSAQTPASAYEQRQAHAELSALLDRLDPKFRVIFWLFEIEERSAKEIADLLDLPETTVFMRLHHARRLLRTMIERRRGKEALP